MINRRSMLKATLAFLAAPLVGPRRKQKLSTPTATMATIAGLPGLEVWAVSWEGDGEAIEIPNAFEVEHMRWDHNDCHVRLFLRGLA